MADDSRTMHRISFALAPDVEKFSTGSVAYDAPAKRRDVLEAFRIMENRQPPFAWRELFPTERTLDGKERLDPSQLPILALTWVGALAGIAILMALAVGAWRLVLR